MIHWGHDLALFGAGWAIVLSGGLALAPTALDNRFTEATIPIGGSPATGTGSSSKTEWYSGAYVSGFLAFAIAENSGLFASVQFQQVNDLEQTVNGHTATVDMGATVFGVFGARITF